MNITNEREPTDDKTVAMIAAEQGHVQVLKFLMENGATPGDMDRNGKFNKSSFSTGMNISLTTALSLDLKLTSGPKSEIETWTLHYVEMCRNDTLIRTLYINVT